MHKTNESTMRADFIEQELNSYEYSAKELAKLINVSPATVSMVFNNKPGISDATRELVLKTAAEYGYAPKKK